jgi:thioesterase domain-containing protein
MEKRLEELQHTWHTKIPISQAMDIRIDNYGDNCLVAHASLAPNVNVHGTAFAGSIYAVSALVGWGMTWLQLRLREIDGSIVIANGHIDYARPVTDDFIARCQFDEAAQRDAFLKLEKTGKTRFPLECEIALPDATQAAAVFTGSYAVLVRA